MRILIEGERYPLDLLNLLLKDHLFYFVQGDEGIINHVGYIHALDLGEVIYLLPKVFYWNNLVLGHWELLEVARQSIQGHLGDRDLENSIRHFLILFYKSLVEFKKRNSDTEIIEKQSSVELSSNLGNQEYTFLDLLLSFLSFHKKNNRLVARHTIEKYATKAHRANWSKTVRKTKPIFDQKNQPVYTRISNKKKIQYFEEELIIIYLSILYHFKRTYQFSIFIPQHFPLLKNEKFKQLKRNGSRILKKLRNKYFSDQFKQMYRLCELFFDKIDRGNIRQRKSEYITIRNYNLVFEDMVDKLFTDEQMNREIATLKHNKDGKMIDHLFEYQSIIDDNQIYYIGDSKYYKTGRTAAGKSLYKQFTYAKNVIQFNIDLLNEGQLDASFFYRDALTEGYNISPNFFIYGFIPTNQKQKILVDFENSCLKSDKKVQSSYHFKGRLFDRDTLFVHQYQLNFLFILNAYTSRAVATVHEFRQKTKLIFRKNILHYLNNESDFLFYRLEAPKVALEKLVYHNFRKLNGKCISLRDGSTLLIALKRNDVENYKEILSMATIHKLKP